MVSCLGNPDVAGLAFYCAINSMKTDFKKGILTTNNRMELLASIEALNTLTEACEVTVHSDSQYMKNGITRDFQLEAE